MAEKNVLFRNYTDEDWRKEEDVKVLHAMTLNWKILHNKWSDIAEEKMQEVSNRINLTDSDKYLLWCIGYYKPATLNEEKCLKRKNAEIKRIGEDFQKFALNELRNNKR